MKSITRYVVLGILLIVTPVSHGAQEMSHFEALVLKVRSEADPILSAEISENLVDCSHLGADADKGAETQGSEYAQWIYNDFYVWRLIQARSGYCVYLSNPEKRGLDVNDATALLIAHEREFPIANDDPPSSTSSGPHIDIPIGPYPEHFIYHPSWATEKSEKSNTGLDCEKPDSDSSINVCDTPDNEGERGADFDVGNESKGKTAADTRQMLHESTYPYNTLALVERVVNPSHVRVPGSAVQVSPFVFATAAHVISNNNTSPQGSTVYVLPSYKVPVETDHIRNSGIVIFPGYDPNPSGAAAADRNMTRDLGFIRINRPKHLPYYPWFFLHGSDAPPLGSRCPPNYLHVGNIQSDPFSFLDLLIGTKTFYKNDILPAYDNFSLVFSLGYPWEVGTIDNLRLHNPYIDKSGSLQGYPWGCELLDISRSTDEVIGAETYVTRGNSGGPLFGIIGEGSQNQRRALLGIITNQIPQHPFPVPYGDRAYASAIGRTWYNRDFITENASWVPGNVPIDVQFPEAGSRIEIDSILEFSASAEDYTDQLKWYSDIDGYLGEGGRVAMAGKISEGPQLITVQIDVPTGVLSSVNADPASRIEIGFEVLATPSSLLATPSTVEILPGESLGLTSLSWSAPSYANVDLYRTMNGVDTLVTSGPTSGAVVVPAFLGVPTTFKLYRQGSRARLLASVDVTGIPAPVEIVDGKTKGPDGFTVELSGHHFASNAVVETRASVSGNVIGRYSGAQLTHRVVKGIEYLDFYVSAAQQQTLLAGSGLYFWVVNPDTATWGGPRKVVRVPPPNVPPTVAITTPGNGASFLAGQSVLLKATAGDPDGVIVHVEFWDGATFLGNDPTDPFSFSWAGASVGVHQVTAKAFDQSNPVGTTTSAAVSVTVNAPPTVMMTSPISGTTLGIGEAVVIRAEAADVDNGVARVEFMANSVYVGQDTAAPFTLLWQPQSHGSFALSAVAFDRATVPASVESASTSVTVVLPPDAISHAYVFHGRNDICHVIYVLNESAGAVIRNRLEYLDYPSESSGWYSAREYNSANGFMAPFPTCGVGTRCMALAHSFSGSGTYRVRVSAELANGTVATLTKSVEVEDGGSCRPSAPW